VGCTEHEKLEKEHKIFVKDPKEKDNLEDPIKVSVILTKKCTPMS
jgi:hypothetical protein